LSTFAIKKAELRTVLPSISLSLTNNNINKTILRKAHRRGNSDLLQGGATQRMAVQSLARRESHRRPGSSLRRLARESTIPCAPCLDPNRLWDSVHGFIYVVVSLHDSQMLPSPCWFLCSHRIPRRSSVCVATVSFLGIRCKQSSCAIITAIY